MDILSIRFLKVDTLIDLLDSGFKIEKVWPFVIGYIFIVWFMFAVWLLIDAYRRYENPFIAGAFFLLVLPLNFPALVFYLIIRPETEEEIIAHFGHMDTSPIEGGVNVPLVNFVGRKGVEMGITLKISNNMLQSTANNMNINVDWKSKDANFKTVNSKETRVAQIQPQKQIKTIANEDLSKKAMDKAGDLFSKVKNKLSSIRIKSEAPKPEVSNQKGEEPNITKERKEEIKPDIQKEVEKELEKIEKDVKKPVNKKEDEKVEKIVVVAESESK